MFSLKLVSIFHRISNSACEPFNNTAKFQIIRNPGRMGLIKSRNVGASMAVGNYILFLDSHCEVNQQWLEPLLATMQQQNNPYVAVSPLLDQIEAESNVYQATADSIKGGFDWSLHFHWLPRKYSLKMKEKPFRLLKFFLCKFLLEFIFIFSFARYFRSPTFAGGIFLISRNWFFKLKAFNTHLEVSR